MERSYAFRANDGHLFLVRCPSCDLENHVMSVSSGQCAWCGYTATPDDLNEDSSDAATICPDEIDGDALRSETTKILANEGLYKYTRAQLIEKEKLNAHS